MLFYIVQCFLLKFSVIRGFVVFQGNVYFLKFAIALRNTCIIFQSIYLKMTTQPMLHSLQFTLCISSFETQV